MIDEPIRNAEPPGLLTAPLRTRGEQIADRLVTAIALGEYVPGQRLPTERELAAALDVSRRSVREALHRLEAEHYIEILRGRTGGAFVRSSWERLSATMVSRTLLPRWDQFEDLFELRRAVEPMIARKAAERRTDADLASIGAAIEVYRHADGREASRTADLAVHATIAAAARNPSLAELSRRLRAEASLGFNAVPWSPEIRAKAIEHHDQFLRAFVHRRPQAAARVALEQVKLTETALRALRDRVASEADDGAPVSAAP